MKAGLEPEESGGGGGDGGAESWPFCYHGGIPTKDGTSCSYL